MHSLHVSVLGCFGLDTFGCMMRITWGHSFSLWKKNSSPDQILWVSLCSTPHPSVLSGPLLETFSNVHFTLLTFAVHSFGHYLFMMTSIYILICSFIFSFLFSIHSTVYVRQWPIWDSYFTGDIICIKFPILFSDCSGFIVCSILWIILQKKNTTYFMRKEKSAFFTGIRNKK